MSAAHREPIRKRLEAEGFNLPELERAGSLVCKDAKLLLSTFLANGRLDEVEFKNAIGNLIEKAKVASGDLPGTHVRVFGEMVDLIWKDDLRNTHRLEELWNEVIEAHSVPLLCAYSLAGIKPSEFPAALLSCHSHNMAATGIVKLRQISAIFSRVRPTQGPRINEFAVVLGGESANKFPKLTMPDQPLWNQYGGNPGAASPSVACDSPRPLRAC